MTEQPTMPQDPNMPTKNKLPLWVKLIIVMAILGALFFTALTVGIYFLGAFVTSDSGQAIMKKGIESAIESGLEKSFEGSQQPGQPAIRPQVDLSGNGIVIKDPNSGQTFSAGAGQELPKDLPTDVPLFQPSTVLGHVVLGPITMVTLETTATMADVAQFYRTKMAESGWNNPYGVDTAPIQGQDNFTGFYKKDNRQVTVATSSEAGSQKTSIVLTFGLDLTNGAPQ